MKRLIEAYFHRAIDILVERAMALGDAAKEMSVCSEEGLHF